MRAEVRRLFTKYPTRKVWVCDLRVPGLLLSLTSSPCLVGLCLQHGTLILDSLCLTPVLVGASFSQFDYSSVTRNFYATRSLIRHPGVRSVTVTAQASLPRESIMVAFPPPELCSA